MEDYKNPAQANTYRNHNVGYIDMAEELGSTGFSDPFYEVSVSTTSLLGFCSQNLVFLRVALCSFRGHSSLPEHP